MYAPNPAKLHPEHISYDGLSWTYDWIDSPDDIDPDSPAGYSENILNLFEEGVTHDVQYDMAPLYTARGVHCRPWYMNTCAEINFLPGGRIFNQQHLCYNRAWVDFLTPEGQWRLFASPLQGVVAGDMYLPSANARQETPRFQDISFTFGPYNRFAPAVYQRSWDKATANVFKIEGDVGPSPENVAIRADWSHVYNDVAVPYTPGVGFTVRPDAEKLGEAKPDTVLFRLPKADTSFLYFTDGDTPQSGTSTDIDRGSGHYRLNDVQGQIQLRGYNDNTRYFLVGNPFMDELDLNEFFRANSSVIAPKLWIIDGDSQTAAVFTDKGIYSSSGEPLTSVAPLQGFFVEALSPGSSLTLNYNADMMLRNVAGTDQPLLAPAQGSTRNSQPSTLNSQLIITALRAGKTLSAACLVLDDGISQLSALSSQLSVPLLYDPETSPHPAVYTASGGKALSVNLAPSAADVEIGLIDPAVSQPSALSSQLSETTLRFSGTALEQNLTLTDLLTGQTIPLTEGLEYTVRGNVAGRLFLSASKPQEEIASLRIAAVDGGVEASTGRYSLAVDVCDTQGRLVSQLSALSSQLTVPLPPGIYIVRATDGTEKATLKAIIK